MIMDESANSPKNKNTQKDFIFNGSNQVNVREDRNNNFNSKGKFDECPPDLFTNPQNNQQNRGQQVLNKNIQLDPVKKQQTNINQNINLNTYIINKKEAKKYEELLKYNNAGSGPNSGDVNNSNQHSSTVKTIKMGKVILEPINNNIINKSGNPLGGVNGNLNNNKMNDTNQTKKNFHSSKNKKMEVSFKATLKFSDENGNNKIEISPNFNLN